MPWKLSNSCIYAECFAYDPKQQTKTHYVLTEMYCADSVLTQLVLTTSSWGGEERSVQQTNNPELCWESDSPNLRAEGLVMIHVIHA